MIYLKRVGVTFLASFLVLMSYTFAAKFQTLLGVGLEGYLILIIGVSISCLPGSLLFSAIFQKNPVIMVVSSQILSILIIWILWSLSD